MTKLEEEIVSIVRGQGLTVLATHCEHHLCLDGGAFLNLTSVAASLQDHLDMIAADTYAQGYEDGAGRRA